MRRIVIPKCYDDAAARMQQLDEELRAIAEVINGGLDADALDAALKLMGFLERNSLVMLSGQIDQVDGSTGISWGNLGYCPFDAYLVAISALASYAPVASYDHTPEVDGRGRVTVLYGAGGAAPVLMKEVSAAAVGHPTSTDSWFAGIWRPGADTLVAANAKQFYFQAGATAKPANQPLTMTVTAYLALPHLA